MPKYIETTSPFAHLSVIAERESWRKEVYRPVYYLHKWWAKRLGTVFRGIVLGSCLENNENFWDAFYRKNSFENTVIFDPFMGSGVTLGEALKLGCHVVGRDINPVSKVACEAALSSYNISDVLETYALIKNKVSSKLLKYFRTKTQSGQDATVLYFFLVKQIDCPDCGKEIDLFKSRIFSKNAIPRKDPSARCVCPNPNCGDIHHIRYDDTITVCHSCSLKFNPQKGNIQGANVTCESCNHTFRLVEAMKQHKGPLTYRRYAKMVLLPNGKKTYEPLSNFDRELEAIVRLEAATVVDSFPDVPISPGYNTNQILKHNYTSWIQLFSDRQIVCIKHLINEIKEIREPRLKLLFSCLLSGVLEFNNLFNSFKGEGTGAVRHMFSHHVLKPEVMPLEANIWGTNKSSGSFSTLFKSRVERALSYKADPFELKINSTKSSKVHHINQPIAANFAKDFDSFSNRKIQAFITVGNSSCTDLPDGSVDLVITDPPFFDNVHYSELADFFYYWLNQMLDLSPKNTTRSSVEVQDTNSELFTKKLTSVFAECRRVLHDKGLFVFTYHHSRHEGWVAVHQAIRHAGFTCVQAYPVKAEMSVSMPLQQAKSPIHLDLILVCRKDSHSDSHYSDNCNIDSVLEVSKQQVVELKSSGIKVSMGDAKVIMMGRFLCEAHKARNLETEEKLLNDIENDIDNYVSQLIKEEGEVLYKTSRDGYQQLTLFEKMGQYLANNSIERTQKTSGA
ncbi:MAG: hypothetical protein D3916_03615 [Candidatus Electrothrix sp. MAN1_4]|nr:hypothetical protein [Candidatus Electrothrix sp. MAN1_4]